MSEREFLFEYRFDGDVYGLPVMAASPEEARRKISAMGLATYKGEIGLKIKIPGVVKRLFGLWPRP